MLQSVSRWILPPAIIVAALFAYRLVFALAGPSPDAAISSRQEPWEVTSVLREPRVCSDQQLAEILDRVKPPREPFTSNNLVHALRLWGPDADFGDETILSGQRMRSFLLDDRVYRQIVGGKSPPLLIRGPDGIDLRSYDDSVQFQHTSSYHTDDVLATLAETGTPLNAPLVLRDGQGEVRELLEGVRRRFYLDRHEYEWSIIALARYGWPLSPWRNKCGEKIDLAAIVLELTDKPAEIGPCDGLHRLEALAVIYRLDQQSPALPPRARQRMLAYMKQVSDRLVQSQSVEGYWASGWSRSQSKVQSRGTRAAGLSKVGGPMSAPLTPTLHDKLLVTGHHLEWLALAPEEIQPPRETIVRAGQWLAGTLLEMDQKTLLAAYGPYSHAARALCLWKGVEPIDAWRRLRGATLAAQ